MSKIIKSLRFDTAVKLTKGISFDFGDDVLLLGPSGWDGSGDTASLFLGDTTNFITSINPSAITIGTAGEERLRIADDGMIGIGTDNPLALLHVRADNSDTFSSNIDVTDVNRTAYLYNTNATTNAYSTLSLRSSGYISDIKSVNTGSNAGKLVFSLRTTSAFIDILELNSLTGTANFLVGNDSNKEILLGTPRGNTGIQLNSSNLGNYSRFDIRNVSDAIEANRYVNLGYNADGGAVGLNILKGGNVGIATIFPTEKLHVSGNAYITNNLLFDSASVIGLNTTDGSDDGFIILSGGGADGSTRGGRLVISGNERLGNEGDIQILAGTTGDISFHTNGDAEQMRLDVNGNLGIGTNNPTEILHVEGNIRLSGDLNKNGNVLTLPTSTETLVGRDTTDTLTNKTLITPDISTISNTGILTLPTSTDTLVGRDTTDTLTNKTLTSPVISTISNTGTLTLPTSTDTLVGRDTIDTLTNKTLDSPVLTGNLTLTDGSHLATDEVRARDGDGLRLFDDSNKGIFVEDGGNVGIGTTAPDTLLSIGSHVIDDNSYVYDTDSVVLTHQTSTANAVLNDPQQILYLTRQGTDAQCFGAKVSFALSRYEEVAANSRTRLDLYMAHSSYDDVITTTWLSNGNVGIGTDNPVEALHIAGNIRLSGTLNKNTNALTLPDSTDTLVGRNTTDTLTNKTLTAPIISTISNTGTLTLPTSTDTLVGRATTDTLTNKTLVSPILTGDLLLQSSSVVGLNTVDASDNGFLILSGGGADGSTRGGRIVLSGNERVANTGDVQLLAGITGDILFHTNSDVERMRIDVYGNVGIGTNSPEELLHVDGNIRLSGTLNKDANALTLPDSTDTLVGRDTTDTLTNKTLTTPIISSISNTGILTLPTSTDTLVGRDTTDTLTNKTLTSPIISSISNTGTLTLPTSTDTLVGRDTTDTLTNKTLASPILTGDLLLQSSSVVGVNTTDANDNGFLVLSGGGDDGNTRGGRIVLSGNERSLFEGDIQVLAGAVGDISFYTNGDIERMRINSSGDILFGNPFATGGTVLGTNTADAFDNEFIVMTGGGADGNTRGGRIVLSGNERVINSGNVEILSGTTGNIKFYTNGDTERIHIDVNGNVGIGTDNPNELLHVDGNIRLSGTLNKDANVLTLPDSSDTLVARNTTDTLTNKTLTAPIISSISNTGTLTLPTSTDTLVGRNTADILTNKTIASPIVTGDILLQSSGVVGLNTIDASDNGFLVLSGGGDDGSTRGGRIVLSGNERVANTGDVQLLAGITGDIIFHTNSDVEQMRVDVNGNVGIGTNSPTEVLHVDGNIRLSGDLNKNGNVLTLPTSTDTLVGRDTTDTLTNKTLTTPIISTISNTGTLTLPTSTDTLVGRNTIDTLTNKTFESPVLSGDLTLTDGSHLATDEVRARDGEGLKLFDASNNGIFVEDGGNIGIGTTTPSYQLHVQTSGSLGLCVDKPTQSTSTNFGNFFGRDGNVRNGIFQQFFYAGDGSTANYIHWDFNSQENVLVLKADGNVGLSETTPLERLHVSGNIRLSGTLNKNENALTLPDSTDTLVGRNTTDTLTNKTLTTPIISSISNTGTLTLPTSTDTLVGRDTTDTLTNKTLTTPIISTISNTGTLTLPTSTDTLVGRATTDTLTNKTLASPIISSISNTGTLTLPTSTDTLVGRDTMDTLTNKTLASPLLTGDLLLQTAGVVGLNTIDDSDDGFLIVSGGGADGSTRGGRIVLSGNERVANTGDVQLLAGITGDIIFHTNSDVEQMRIDVYGNVGIGTNIPSYKLQVQTTGSLGLCVDKPTQSTSTDFGNFFGRDGNVRNGIFQQFFYAGNGSTANYIHWDFNNQENVLVLKADGNVGLSETTPLERLHVDGNIRLSGTLNKNANALTLPDSTDTLVGRNTSDTLTNKTLTTPIISSISNTGTLTLPTSTDTLVGRATTDTLTNKTLASPLLTGDVLLQTTSVIGLNTIDASDNGFLVLSGGGGDGSTRGGRIVVSGNERGIFPGTVEIMAGGAGDIKFYTNSDTERIHVDVNGNVGIGTDNPNELLHVDGNIRLSGTLNKNANALTLPDSTDTLVGRNTSDTLTNKTLTTPIISSISNTGTLTLPTSTDTLVGRDTTDTLTNKTLASPLLTGDLLLQSSSVVGLNTIDTNDNGFLVLSGGGDDGSTRGGRIVLSGNERIVNSGNVAIFAGGAGDIKFYTNSDTERIHVDVNGNVGIGTDNPDELLHVDGNIRLSGTLNKNANALTLPDSTDTLVGRATTDTLTNKTLTTPIISSISNTGTLTLPTSTDTLVGRATTDTLTNKTLTAPIISSISNTGTLTLPTSTDTLVGRDTTDTLTNKTIVSPSFTGDLSLDDGSHISTDEIRARDADGLKLFNDSNNGIFVEDSGDVGIGTTTPSYKLQVQTTGSLGLCVDKPTQSTSTDFGNFFGRDGNVRNGIFQQFFYADDGSTSNYVHWDFNSQNNVLVLKADGNVGLSEPTPLERLHVSGNIRLSGTLNKNANALTLPDSTDTLVARNTTDTLTNKTLTTPIISSISNTGTLTLPTSTDTLVGRATTDTLTNKTLTAPIISTISNTGTLTLPTSTDTLVGRDTTDTLTNKTLSSPILTGDLLLQSSSVVGLNTVDASDNGFLVLSGGGDDGSTRGGRIVLSGNERVANTGDVQLLAGITGDIIFHTNSDVEQMRIDVNGYVGIGTNNPDEILHVDGNIRLSGTLNKDANALTLPDSTDTLVGRDTTDTLTNKTLTTPIISSISNTGTLTLPTSTDTLVGRDTTDTLTNKTLTAPIISSISNTGTLTLPTSTDTLVGRDTTDTLTNKTLASPILTGDLLLQSSSVVGLNTTDASDNGFLVLSGGGDDGSTRGGRIVLSGNERSLFEGDIQILAGAAGDISFHTNGDIERMRINSSGNILFGNPLATGGTVLGTNTADAFDNEFIVMTGGGADGSTRGGRIVLSGNERIVNSGNIEILAGTTGNIKFYTNGDTERIHIDVDGNVGIGTDNPSELLHVDGNIRLSGTLNKNANALTLPDSTDTLVGRATTDTLTNKTLTTPIISSISNTGTLTLPTSTDTLVGRNTTDTLTNKTLTAPVISSISNTGTLTLPTSTDTLVGRNTTDTLTNKTLASPILTGNLLLADAAFVSTDEVRARDGDGLKLFDDGGNGIFVEDGGSVGIGTNAPETILSIGSHVIDDSSYVYDTDSVVLTHQTSTANAVLNDPQQLLYLTRQGTDAQCFGAKVSFALSRYENVAANSRSRLDLYMAHGSFDDVITTTWLSNGNVGIGTDNPAEALHVAGNIRLSGDLNKNGNVLTLPASTETLVGRNTTDTLTNKTLTAPVISTISNTGTLTLPTSTDTLVGRDTTDTLTNKTIESPILTGNLSLADGTHVSTDEIRAKDGDGLKLFDDSNRGIFIEDGGNVGIGITTPETILSIGSHVIDDNSYVYDTDSMVLTHQTNTANAVLNDPQQLLYLTRQGTDGQCFGAKASFAISRYEEVAANSRTRLDLYMAHSSFDDVITTTWLSNGNVGIGTDNPAEALHVTGNIRLSGTLNKNTNALTLPDSTDTLVARNTTDTLTNKTLTTPVISSISNIGTLTLPTSTDTLVARDTTDTLTNKTLTAPVISSISNTGTLTLPTSTDTLVGRATTDTLTNKTLTTPIISSISNTGTLTLPTSTDTLVGRATTDTLTNKTLTAPVISSISNTGTLTLPTSTDTLVGRDTTDTLTNKTIVSPSFTGNVSLANGTHISTDEIKARDGDGLKLFDDGGNGIFVEDGGSVGIGTNNPSYQLHVQTSTSTGLCIDNPTQSTSTNFGNFFGRNTSVKNGIFQQFYYAGDGSSSNHVRWDFNSQNNVLVLRANGNVGIGSSTPGFQLTLTTDSAAKPTTNTWTISSDVRLKEGITGADYDISYQNIKDLELKYYKWKDEYIQHHSIHDCHKIGWIADDVESIFPKAVRTYDVDEDSSEYLITGVTQGIKSLNTDLIYAGMFGAIKKLIEKVEVLEQENINMGVTISSLLDYH